MNTQKKIMYFPKISIVTPSFNQGPFIEQTILSVIDQDYPNLEYIIIDGGSSDNTLEIIKKHEKHIHYWISEPDKGQSDAINKGLKIATGSIINWLNSDDYYEPGILKKVAEAFQNEKINIVSGKGRLFKGNETIGYTKGVDIYPGNISKTIGWLRMDQPETFYRSNVLKVIGELDIRLHYLMDRDWWLKYLLLFGLDGVCQLPEILVNFRLHEISKTVSQKEGFHVEHHTLFAALANFFNRKDYFQLIAKRDTIYPHFNLQLEQNLFNKFSAETIEKIFNYYFLLRGDISYASDDKESARNFYSLVNSEKLDLNDKFHFYDMRLRNSLPFPLIQFVRKLTRK